jgi:hypothetical protein
MSLCLVLLSLPRVSVGGTVGSLSHAVELIEISGVINNPVWL